MKQERGKTFRKFPLRRNMQKSPAAYKALPSSYFEHIKVSPAAFLLGTEPPILEAADSCADGLWNSVPDESDSPDLS